MNKRNFFLQQTKNRLLKDNIDVKNIEIERPHPVLLDNLPLICIYSANEDFTRRSGSDFQIDTYRNLFDINIDIIMKNIAGTEFKLNEIASQIEDSLSSDIFFKKITGEKQPDNEGLIIKSSNPYSFDVGGQESYAATNIVVGVRYIADGIPDIRTDEFTEISGTYENPDYAGPRGWQSGGLSLEGGGIPYVSEIGATQWKFGGVPLEFNGTGMYSLHKNRRILAQAKINVTENN